MPRGKISRLVHLDPAAFGIVRGEDVDGSYVFGFDRIAGYRGESIRATGFRVGADVTFELRDGHVEVIRLSKAS